MDNRTISICIPTYNRYEMTIEAIEKIMFDPRISEIIISDDCSIDGSYQELIHLFDLRKNFIGYDKVKLFQNNSNQDCYWNKRIAVESSTNEWCILLDSDNIIDTTYLDKLFAIPDWSADTIYTPQFAKPHFDFRSFAGITLTKDNIKHHIDLPGLETCLNACNYFVNREEYLLCFDSSKDPVTSDSIFYCYNWLRSGNQIHILPGLEYEHRIGHPSHYTINQSRTPAGFHQDILNKLRNL